VLVAAGLVVFASLLGALVLYGLIAANQVHLDRLDTQLDQERAALARDQYQLANLQSPERIATEAARLGMVPAQGQTWLSPTGSDPMVTGDQQAPPATPTDGPADQLAGGADAEAGA
jgi:hypothetical protein